MSDKITTKEFDDMLEVLFKPVKSNTAKLVYCCRCHTEVLVVKGADCECGYIQELVTYILKNKDNK